jgi:phosphate transport system ATP-binding protein
LRIADVTAFFDSGDLVEWGPTSEVFSRPVQSKTADYVSGKYG